jgi:hypothetical protein
MESSRSLVVLSALIAVLSLFASGAGVFWRGEGDSYEFTTLRNETVEIYGRGLYRYDTVSVVSQGVAQDVVTLAVGIPLLSISVVLFRRGSLRGKLLLTGTLGYFLYTYASYCFLAAYNSLFLAYVALFSMSVFAFSLAIMSVDVQDLPNHFSPKLPRKPISVLLFVIGAFLLVAWLGRIIPAMIDGTPPFGLESYTTLVIQVLDLGLVVPLAILSAVLLLKDRPFGYLLTSLSLVKGFTMTIAVSAMVAGQLLAGTEVALAEVAMFPILTLFVIASTVVLLRNLEE